MRRWILTATATAFSGAVAVLACGSDAIVDGRSQNPNFEHPDGGGTSGTSGTTGTSGTSGTTGPTATGQALCSGTVGELFLGGAERCCSATEKSDPSYASSKVFFDKQLADCNAAYDGAVMRGRVRIGADPLAACTAAIKATSCQDRLQNLAFDLPACGHIVTGLQPLGGACRFDVECADGLSCVGYTATSDGACRAPAIGAACGPAPGSTPPPNYRNVGNVSCASSGHCIGGTCVTGKPAGATCSLDIDCASPLFCHRGTCGTQGPGGAGATCRDATECTRGFYCDVVPPATEGTCATPKAAGQACDGSLLFECRGKCVLGDGGRTCVEVCSSG